MNLLKMTDLDLNGKRVLIRQDLNVPIKNGEVTSDKRIVASLPTILHAIKAGAKVIITSHLGRPNAGEYEEKFSLRPVADHLSTLLGQKVRLESDWLEGVEMESGEVVLCENVRFNEGEKENDETLSKKMAALCDVCVQDAFGTAHRAHASHMALLSLHLSLAQALFWLESLRLLVRHLIILKGQWLQLLVVQKYPLN